MKVCIGGTFNFLHKGHKSLIKKAFDIAGKKGYVFIGITSDKLIEKKRDIQPFEKRKKTIEKFISELRINEKFVIKPIYNRFGPTIKEDFDVIIVSPGTLATAHEINKKRQELMKNPLKIVEIPFVLAQDNKPISSTRIRKKEIDDQGNILNRD